MTNEQDYAEKCNIILNWAERKPKFRTDFIESVLSFIENTEFITNSQMNAIDNIIEKYKIVI
jgi:hypothetical protein